MAKRYNIRWRDSDYENIRREVRNAKARANYIKKHNPELAGAMPELPSVDEIVSAVKTRDDLKRELKSLSKFRGAAAREIVVVPNTEYDLKITKWQYDDMLRREKPINERRAEMREQIQNVEMKSRNQPLGYTRGDIGLSSADDTSTKPMNIFTRHMNKRDLNKKHKTLRKESSKLHWDSKQKHLKDSLIDGIKANYNGYVSEEELNSLVSHIEGLSFEDYYETLMTDTDAREFVSPPPGANMDEHMKNNFEGLKSVWMPAKGS